MLIIWSIIIIYMGYYELIVDVDLADSKYKSGYVDIKTKGGKKLHLLKSNFIKIRNFLNTLERGGASSNTLNIYAEHLLDFFGIVHSDKKIKEIEMDDFEDFWNWKVQENKRREKRKGTGVGRYTEHYKPTTFKTIVSAFRSFFMYAGREDLAGKLKTSVKKTIRKKNYKVGSSRNKRC